jgi:predicted  nucleic acid-binding Zn-ribbon protein
MLDALQTALLLVILLWLLGMKRTFDGAMRAAPDVGLTDVKTRLDSLHAEIVAIRSGLGEMQQDHEILDELEENVMNEWERIIEEELGKRPVQVPCPACGFRGGLEPNLLAEEDQEYGCPSCGLIFTRDALREKYPTAKL